MEEFFVLVLLIVVVLGIVFAVVITKGPREFVSSGIAIDPPR